MPNQMHIPANIWEPFRYALVKVYSNDYLLIKNKCCERAIVFRLGLYLAGRLRRRGLDVDCEYNKEGENAKALPESKYNYPDIIVHKRMCRESNLLIVEVKTSNDARTDDLERVRKKLIEFTQDERYLYKWGVHAYLAGTFCCLVWYQQGMEKYYFKLPITGNNCTLESQEHECMFVAWYNGLRQSEARGMLEWRVQGGFVVELR